MQALARLIPSRIAIEVSGAVLAWLAVIIVLAAVDSGPGGGSAIALSGPGAGANQGPCLAVRVIAGRVPPAARAGSCG